MHETYLNVNYSILRRYAVNPLTGDRYFSGYEAQIISTDSNVPIVVGVFRNRRQAIQQAKAFIIRFREEFALDSQQSDRSFRFYLAKFVKPLYNRLSTPIYRLLNSDSIHKNPSCETDRSI
ncbi:hypothetical protein [Geitlerinema calcuttense]|uniref:Uncharacterized protein n=1 Tax=Geitlerinema calcuttense NRMC-F 0142 TaxID=2922238 RepID=A0ABT7M1W4_9CYAN|nr:hypothetical protein [Geitlerinema calcuttense]MDL5057365.1 hypothetical protein [Geitlerinema calcuttense NRMC-F 0142]